MKPLILIFLLTAKICFAGEPTEIFGEAETPSGKEVSALMLEPEEHQNKTRPQEQIKPKTIKEKTMPEKRNAEQIKEIDQWSPQNPKPFSISPQAEQNEIENTLYEGGNRIYDVQSYPIKDIKTITEPNVDPTISTYPEY